MTAKSPCVSIVLDVVVADDGKVRHFESLTNFVEELPLFVTCILNVIPDELNQIGPNQVVGLVDDPACDRDVFDVPARSDANLRDDHDDRLVELVHQLWTPESVNGF